MSKKILTRFNIQIDYLELIAIESNKRGISKHEYLNYVLYEYLVKKQNRLSNHVVRDVENLVLMLLTSKDTYENLEDIFKKSKHIDKIKRTLLHKQKNSTADSGFFNQILTELHPDELLKITTQTQANSKLKTLYSIVEGHKDVFI